jgi:threonine/homoserine/homoserine lactone efflux protein
MFLKGLILGFSIAAPVGPIGLLCIQRTLQRGRLAGFVSGLGAATADACYGLVAAFGLSTVISFLLGLQFWLQLGGGMFLLGLGLKTLFAEPTLTPAAPAATPDKASLAAAFTSIVFLTLANPATILSFFAVFAGLGIDARSGNALALVGGVFLGSATWWLILSFLAGLLRRHLNDGRMRLLNVIAGFCLLGLALWALWPLVRPIVNQQS